MSQLAASFQHQIPQFVRDNMGEALIPLKQDGMGVQAGHEKLEVKVDQLSRELNAVHAEQA